MTNPPSQHPWARRWRLHLLALLILSAFTLQPSPPSFAQEPVPNIPDDAAVDIPTGLSLYASRCATCHGLTGLGDGELAAQLPNPPAAIGSDAYLDTADGPRLFNLINNGNVARGMPGFGAEANSNPLTADEIWSLIAALPELERLAEPISAATITGSVRNASTNSTAAVSGLTVTLQGYTIDFAETFRQETQLDADGRFTFDLQNIPPSWIFRAIINYRGLDFTSDFGRLNPTDPQLDLSLELYETTSDPAVVRIDQLDIITEFVEETVRVNELYAFGNNSTAVFVGETGDFRTGTLTLSLPREAANVSFLRGFGGPTDFAPLNEGVSQTADGYRIALPIAPGEATLRLLVRYELPYPGEQTIAHTLPYPTDGLWLLVPSPEVDVADGAGWQPVPFSADAATADALTAMGEPTRYNRLPLPAGSTLEVPLTGQPRLVLNREGNAIVRRDEGRELRIGGAALLVVVAVSLAIAFRWRRAAPTASERDVLLQQLVLLDEAYAADRVGRGSYQRQRRQLIERLAAVWQPDGR